MEDLLKQLREAFAGLDASEEEQEAANALFDELASQAEEQRSNLEEARAAAEANAEAADEDSDEEGTDGARSDEQAPEVDLTPVIDAIREVGETQSEALRSLTESVSALVESRSEVDGSDDESDEDSDERSSDDASGDEDDEADSARETDSESDDNDEGDSDLRSTLARLERTVDSILSAQPVRRGLVDAGDDEDDASREVDEGETDPKIRLRNALGEACGA